MLRKLYFVGFLSARIKNWFVYMMIMHTVVQQSYNNYAYGYTTELELLCIRLYNRIRMIVHTVVQQS